MENPQHMVHSSIHCPKSITIVGASNHINKAGGKLVYNLIHSDYKGKIFPVNLHEKNIQGLKSYASIAQTPSSDLAILAIPAAQCVQMIKQITESHETKAFIIVSGGFGETDEEGKKREQELIDLSKEKNLTIIGPNCIGVMTMHYNGIFVNPPILQSKNGVDFASASGAIAVFLLEQSFIQGLRFSSIYSLGNSIQTSVEDLLEYWDTHHTSSSSKVKMIYAENIPYPTRFYNAARSLHAKGCKILVCRAGKTKSGKRAALSHTGAITNNDEVIDLLLKKCGCLLCNSRTALLNTALILQNGISKQTQTAILTHAGGPAILLADQLQNQFKLPELSLDTQKKLAAVLPKESAKINPIDLLATGTSKQLIDTLNILENDISIDIICVIYGDSGLYDIKKTYQQLWQWMQQKHKPTYMVMPSLFSANEAMQEYVSKGGSFFVDEVELATNLQLVYSSISASSFNIEVFPGTEVQTQQSMPDEEVIHLLKSYSVPYVNYDILLTPEEIYKCGELHFPMVAKGLGILHKTEHQAVIPNLYHKKDLENAIKHLFYSTDCKEIMVQEMLDGYELYVGAIAQKDIGYLFHIGLGGTMLELQKDIISLISPFDKNELIRTLNSIRIAPIFEGFRNKPPVDKNTFVEIILRIQALLYAHPEIYEIDLNPIIANGSNITVVDARVIL